ncbi:MAG: hypothetical protein HRU29_11975 [Rhizobiales bacterium]|nr:hypothetical protein [Hyphomicrobiales bacterium]NRB15106.1 hypothetical protein [Hyphomicrobiales bacterium]
MASRKGVLIVPVNHPLQPSGTAVEIQQTAQNVIGKIQDIFQISEKSLNFEIKSYSNSSNPVVSILESVTDGHSDKDEIRVIYSNTNIPNETVKRFLAKNTLVVVVEETRSFSKITALVGATGCRVSLPSRRATRFVEDIFIDIFVGRLLTQNDMFSGLIVRQGGLPGLFREKARFFKKNSTEAYISQIAKDAGYAPLSALNNCPDNDIECRAKSTIDAWNRFNYSLSEATISKHPRVIELDKKSQKRGHFLQSVPGFGKQLPMARIARSASKLPDGSYTILVLRRSSSVRKNPKTRNKIRSLFGTNARINSFRFVSKGAFSTERKTIGELLDNKYIAGLNVDVNGSDVSLTPDPIKKNK